MSTRVQGSTWRTIPRPCIVAVSTHFGSTKIEFLKVTEGSVRDCLVGSVGLASPVGVQRIASEAANIAPIDPTMAMAPKGQVNKGKSRKTNRWIPKGSAEFDMGQFVRLSSSSVTR